MQFTHNSASQLAKIEGGGASAISDNAQILVAFDPGGLPLETQTKAENVWKYPSFFQSSSYLKARNPWR